MVKLELRLSSPLWALYATRFADLAKRCVPAHFPIAYKLAAVFAAVIAVVMVALGAVVVEVQTQLLRQQMGEFGHTVARQLAESTKEPMLAGDRLAIQAALSNLVGRDNVLGAAVYSDELNLIARSGERPDDMPVAPAAAERIIYDWEGTGPGSTPLLLSSFAAPVIFQDVVVGFVVITFDRTFMASAEGRTIRAVVGATIALLLVGIGASLLLGKQITRPIDRLMKLSQAITSGDYTVRFNDRRTDELGSLMDSMNAMSEGLLRKEQVEKAFSRYVSPRVAEEVLAHIETVQLGGSHVEASVLFADIIGFTSMSEQLQPTEISTLLNEYFTYIAHAAEAFNGHVDKYIGDCAMLVFGVPTDDVDHAFNAVACGLAVIRVVDHLNAQRMRDGLAPVEFRIGVNTGMMLAGNMGSRNRMEYTVVGDAVNLASRLSAVGESGQVTISAELHDDPRLAGRFESEQRNEIRLRGKRLPIATYAVTGLTEPGATMLQEKVNAILRREVAG